ncbi:hypothetical protein HYN59_09125 [Flavobacterium album]|uniref:Radical SAM protein n=1 Tax=Flavobacterium album TaxID=2175091 RepID=A0A2S1QY56_9FLAO|nr:hypothetical protein [Flavobacterium album]AWH85269.1 hypothetical protein HYN59_09125 [Flavobacterium album]
MNKNILLIEPNYKNKYPPIGLMKISTYHKTLGDNVKFFKGNINELINQEKLNACLDELKKKFTTYDWDSNEVLIYKYLKNKRKEDLQKVLKFINDSNKNQIIDTFKYYAYKYKPYHYDRIYVTTLFTFYWSITIKTIQQISKLTQSIDNVKVGGVMASLLTDEIEHETGIKPFTGLLDKPKMLDPDNNLIVDDLDLDYSILDEIEYKYPTGSAYFTFMTKGCTRKCAFCSVPILEPIYKDKVSSIQKFENIATVYGEQRNLLLMDNNVLASPKFPEIITEIKSMGFYRGAKYTEPNQLDIAIKNLKKGFNDKGFINRSHEIILDFLSHSKGELKNEIENLLTTYNLQIKNKITKQDILNAYKELQPLYERYRKKSKVERYVDFNQGIDARYVTDENMRLLSEINVRPLRIAFDFIGMDKQYIAAVELAAKYGIINLSNYLLYNFKDKPQDLYLRMKINVDLNKKYNLKIFSFPMKYIPLFGEDAKDRKYISKHWNRKYIRAVQSMLNVTKGIVAPGFEFFEMAFGKDLKEFNELLYMPEDLIIYRNKFKDAGVTEEWRTTFYNLSELELAEAKKIIEKNDFSNIQNKTDNPNIYKLLRFYNTNVGDKGIIDFKAAKLRKEFNKLFKNDPFLNLTMTYDFDEPLINKAI